MSGKKARSIGIDMIVKQKGMSLLEVLLVISVATFLLLGGLWAAISVRESHNVGEMVRLINMIRSETNRLRGEMSIPIGANLEDWLLAKNRIAHRFVNETDNALMTPYSSEDEAVSVVSRDGAITEISFAMPPAKAVELLSQFSVESMIDLEEVRVCGNRITPANASTQGTPTAIILACGSSKDLPTNPNVIMLFRS